MDTIALLGTGGKMGRRLATNLKNSRWDVSYVEVNRPRGSGSSATSASPACPPTTRSRTRTRS
jgi:prephenate dehydrogenase